MWLLSSRSTRRVTSAARASTSARGACPSILLHQRQPGTRVRRDPDRWGRPTGPEELALVVASRYKRWLPLGDRRRDWSQPASQALCSPERRFTTRSSPWSEPSGAAAFCALAIGVDSEVLDIPAEGSCDEPLQCRVEEPNRRARTSWRCVRPRWRVMDVRFLGFGSIEVEGRAYEHDIVISRGAVRKRSKKPSKPYRGKFGHTPLSTDEELPWGGPQLIIGTGAHGSLPIMPEVVAEAARRNIDLVAIPTEQACRLIAGLKRREVRAVLHVTC